MRNTILLLVIFLCPLGLLAQNQAYGEEKGFQKERIFIGGNFGLTFGSYTLINVSPQVGYRFNNYLAAGVGVNAQYISIKQYYANGAEYSRTSQGVTGLNVFGRVYPIEQLMLQVQPEANYVFGNIKYYDGRYPASTKLDAVIVPSLLIGGGAVIPSGGRSAFIASVFYDILQDKNSPYGSRPIYNFGYNVSLH